MTLLAELANFALAFAFWATLGRMLLTAITGGQDNFFLGVLRKATDPFYAVVRRVLPERFVPLGVLVLVLVLRVALLPLLRAT